MTSERWLPISGWEGFYEVSDLGRVRSLPRTVVTVKGHKHPVKGCMLKPYPDRHGYHRVVFTRPGHLQSQLVHRAVLSAFVGPSELQCCHKDGNPSNNHVDNLYWGTASDNMQDTLRMGRHHLAKRTHCKYGHEYTPENTWIRVRPGAHVKNARVCITCKGPGPPEYKEITHCPQGHLYDEQNSYVDPKGCRRCKACNRDRSRARLARLKEAS